jgi:hypothetical protein
VPFSSPRITQLGLLIRVYCVKRLLGGWIRLAPLRGKSACPRFSNAESRPGPDGHVPLFFSSIATRRFSRANPPLCGLFAMFHLEEESAIDTRTMEAVCTCDLALLGRRNGAGGGLALGVA